MLWPDIQINSAVPLNCIIPCQEKCERVLSPLDLCPAAFVNLEQSRRGAGFISHPAVVDNCMQMGPAIGALASMSEDKSKALTRVVAGLAGFHGTKLPDRHQAFCASEMMPQGPSGEIYTSHWILAEDREKALIIKDLKVPFLFKCHHCQWSRLSMKLCPKKRSKSRRGKSGSIFEGRGNSGRTNFHTGKI